MIGRASFLRVSLLSVALLGAAGLLAPPALVAHDVSLGLSGDKLEIKTTKGPKKQRIRVIASGDVMSLGHDPAKTTTWLLVRGYGANGGTSGQIELNPKKWHAVGRGKDLKGYKYLDSAG